MQTKFQNIKDITLAPKSALFEQRLNECEDLLEFAIEAIEFRLRRERPEITEEEISTEIKEWLYSSPTLASDKSQEFSVKHGLN